MFMNRKITATSFIAPWVLLLNSLSSQAAPNYVASVLEFGEQYQAVAVVELNGDGLQDIIVSNWNETNGRELWIYLQQSGGKFPAQASKKVEIKKDIVSYGVADIRDEPGEELLFFTVNALFSYSTQYDAYGNNLRKEADWTFINAVPTQRSTYFFGRFAPLNGTIPILIPGPEQYALFKFPVAAQAANHKPQQPILLPKAQRETLQGEDAEGQFNVNLDNGLRFEFLKPSNFQGLVEKRLASKIENDSDFNQRYGDLDVLLDFQQWISNVQGAQLIPGDELDYIFLDYDKEKKSTLKQRTRRVSLVKIENGKSHIHWQGHLSDKDKIQLFDFNNDGLQDLLAVQVRGTDDVTANIYLNRRGGFQLEEPDQVLKFSGYDVNFAVDDINNDKVQDLIIGAYQISAINALRDGALVRIASIYPGNPNYNLQAGNQSNSKDQTPFAKRPSFRLEENFGADDVKGLTQPVSFKADINGDGVKDTVAIDKRGALAGKMLNKQFQLQDNNPWEFVPIHFVQEFEAHTLNRDQQQDFVLRHQNAITVLVSQ